MMMALKSLLSGLMIGVLGLMPMPEAAAVELGPFDQALFQYTQDGVLDREEYAWLRQLGGGSLPDSDRVLAKHFLGFASKHPGFIMMSYSYYRERKQITLKFAFAPTYSEDGFIEGATYREVLGQISQNDVLTETLTDSQRCGAAALLSAHLLLHHSFEDAFANLGVQTQSLTYRSVHQAQEALYLRANRDGKPGLASIFRYTMYSDGRVDKPVPEGEINDAAQLLKLRVYPMIGPNKQRFNDKQQAITNFWRMYPEAAFLVGVHLNQKNGSVRAPSNAYPQNHFVLIFRENTRIWLLNSGVLDNGNGSALTALSTQQTQDMLYRTSGSVDALTRR